MFRAIPLCPSFIGIFLALLVGSADAAETTASDKRALTALQTYVGAWRGVAQPKRGSSQGAWTEECEWGWRFGEGRAELVADLTQDKYFSKLQLQAGKQDGQFVLLATPAEQGGANGPLSFSGALAEGVLVMTSQDSVGERPARISIRLVAGGDRLLVLYEKRVGEGAYTRLAEVGSTRKGSAFARSATSGPECVVTGGLGTIAVEHESQKYFVCCTGCRDLFLLDPTGVLEEYRERKAAERAEKNK